jgi:hypothetical protein
MGTMKNLLSFLLINLLTTGAFALDLNYNGWNDSALVLCTGTNSVITKAFPLSSWANLAVVLKARDTARMGGLDSIDALWGWQVGQQTGWSDTTWDVPVRFDSINVTGGINFYNSKSATTNLAYGIQEAQYTDTAQSGSTHWFKQVRDVSPGWGVYWRLWVKGLSKNSVTHGVMYWFTVMERDHSSVRNK